MHKYIFLIATFILFSCKEVPRSANSLCTGPKPAKCYAPDPYNNASLGNIPRPQECCVQNKYILPGENAPLPRRGVEFTPNPNPQPGVPQQNFNFRPGASLDINRITGISTGNAPENSADDSTFIKKPEVRSYTVKGDEISKDLYHSIQTGSFKIDLQKSKLNENKSTLPYEQNLQANSLNTPSKNSQWQKPNNIVEKKQQAKFVDGLPSVEEQYSLDAFKGFKQAQKAQNSQLKPKDPFTYEKYNFAETNSTNNITSENTSSGNMGSNMNTEYKLEDNYLKNQEPFSNPTPTVTEPNSDINNQKHNTRNQENIPVLPKLELKINNQEAIKAKEIDDESYQKEDSKKAIIKEDLEFPTLPKLPDF